MTGVVLPSGRVRCRSPIWWIEYRDHNGVLDRKPGYRDRQATRTLAAELERSAARIAEGLESPPTAVVGTLADLADRYRDELARRGRAASHVKRTRACLAFVLDGLAVGLSLPTAIDGPDADRWLHAEARRLEWSPRTFNQYATAARAFGRWLVRRRFAPHNPFEPVELLNPEAGRTFIRRALTAKELGLLLTAAAAGPRRYGMSGPDRAQLYRLAAYTGLRIGELASLTPASFTVEQGKALAVTVAAGSAKNRRTESVPIPASIAQETSTWLKRQTAGVRVFRGWNDWHTRGARMVAEDLAKVKILVETPEGRFDFHALRTTYVTMLARSGATLAEAQKLARHSTPKLTSGTYLRIRPELRAAADRLKAG